MNPSTYLKKVQRFIGGIYYYRNMGSMHSHTLVHLTKLTSIKNKCKWRNVEQDAFGKIKRIVSRGTLLNYPDFNETFKVHTNVSAFQLGSVIIRSGEIIAFYGRKLNDFKNGIR